LRAELLTGATSGITFSYRSLAAFGIPSAVVVFCLTAFTSLDVILVKHLFNGQQAGLYAGLSLIGKVIFYVAAPITTVMYPLITNRFNKKEKYNSILFLSFIVVCAISILVTVFYFLFPEFTVLFFLKKREYLQISGYLGYFGIFMTLFSVVFLLSYYFLSIKKTGIFWVLLGGVIFQGLAIYTFHNNFMDIIGVNMLTIIIVLLILLFYFFLHLTSQTNKKPA
jgi:O-antigen/teichoic acid export membrane protein